MGSQYPHIYKLIREKICLLEYPPGEMLSENKLAAEFGVSRTPIRQVLQRLEFEGLVVSKHGVGTFITIVDLKYLKEVYALRIKLAELIGELSPVRLTKQEIVVFEDMQTRCQQLHQHPSPDYLTTLPQLNMDLHDALMQCIGNRPLRKISDQLYYQTARVWHQILPEMDMENELRIMLDELTDLIDPLKKGDMRQVGQARRTHIANCLTRLQDYLGAE